MECGEIMVFVIPMVTQRGLGKFIAMFTPNWLEIKNVPIKFWAFLPQILKPLGNILQIEDSRVTLPHLNARFFIALNSEAQILGKIYLNFEDEVIFWDIDILGNLNVYFHCKRNEHNRKECPC